VTRTASPVSSGGAVRRLHRWIFVLGALGTAAVLAGTTWSLARMRVDALERAESRLRDLSVLLAEQTDRALTEVDLLLRRAEDDVAVFLAAGRALPAERLQRTLKEMIARSPHVRALIVADAQGNAVVHSEEWPVRKVNYADREYFRVLQAGVESGMFISAPTIGRISGTETLPVVRAVRAPDGTLQAVVIASVRPDYLGRLYRSLDLGPGGGVRLMRQDGIALAVSGEAAGQLGANYGETPLFRQGMEAGDGLVMRHIGGEPRPEPRLSTLRVLSAYPVAIGISFTERSVLREWTHQAWAVGTLGVLTAIALGGLSIRLRRDLRELDSADHRIREGEARLSAIVDSAMDAVIAIDARQRILLFNAAAERIFGISALEAVGTPLDRLIPDRYRAQHQRHVEQFGDTGITTRRMGSTMVLSGLRASGEEFPIDASISHVTVSGQRIFTVILRDITDRVAAEAEIERSHRELRALSKAANEAIEAERRRVARELHDELGQLLTAMKLDLGDLERHLPPGDAGLAESVDRMRGLLDEMVASTRRISTDLRPLMLDDLGLGAALDWLVQNFTKRTGVAVRMEISEALAEVGEPQASAVFRIVQESLTNVARHSGATEVTVQVTEAQGKVTVEVHDNGRGIAPEDQGKRGSFGLLGIRERARLLGGNAIIGNHPSGGAVVTAHMPLAPLADFE